MVTLIAPNFASSAYLMLGAVLRYFDLGNLHLIQIMRSSPFSYRDGPNGILKSHMIKLNL